MNCLSLSRILLMLTPMSLLVTTPALFFPYIFGKNMLFRLLILMSLFCFTLAKRESLKLGLNKFEISFFVYIAISLMAALAGLAPGLSIFSNLERFNGVEGQLYLFLFLYLASRLLDSKQWWCLIFGQFVLISFLINLDTLIKHGTHIATEPGSLFGSKNYLAGFDFSVFMIAIFLYLTHREKAWARAALAVGIVALLVALMTFTRAPLLGFSLAFGIWLIIFRYQSFQHKRWLIPAILTMGLVSVGLIWKFADNLLHTDNMRSRLDMWQISLRGFQESPLLGVGPENFGYLFDKYHPGPYALQGEQWIDNAHNILFNTLAETGALGIISFCVMAIIIFQCAYQASKEKSVNQILLITLIMIYIEQLFTLNPISQNMPQFLIIAYFTKEKSSIQIVNIKGKLFVHITTWMICLAIAFISYQTIIRETYKHYEFSIIYRNFPKDLSTMRVNLSEYFNHPPIRSTYLVQKMAMDFIRMAFPDQVAAQPISMYQKLIVDQLSKCIAANPKNIRTQVILGGLYARFNPPKAMPIFLRVIKQAPRKPMNYVYLAHAYLRVGKKALAEASLKMSLKLDPTFAIAKKMLDEL